MDIEKIYQKVSSLYLYGIFINMCIVSFFGFVGNIILFKTLYVLLLGSEHIQKLTFYERVLT